MEEVTLVKQGNDLWVWKTQLILVHLHSLNREKNLSSDVFL